jgi:hypothetical protein
MYGMQYGNYSWWQPDTYRLLSRRAAAARLTSMGGNYTGWHFVQDDGSFNNFMFHDTIDPYPR